MNNLYAPNEASTHVALHLLINQLTQAVNPSALLRRNTLINEVAPCLLVRTNPAKLSSVIRQLLHTIVIHSEHSFIKLSAKIYGDVLLIHIKKKCSQNKIDMTETLEPLQKMAEELHGNLSVTSHRNEVTTVALSFMNQPVAA